MDSRAGSDAAGSAIAIFDLDGTLTRRDTLLPYLAGFVAVRPARWLSVFGIGLALAGFVFGRLDRDKGKERIIAACLRVARRDELGPHTSRFVDGLLKSGMHSQALSVLESHRTRGAHLVLLSASPDVYVREIAARLKFDECICTELRWEGERLLGTFATRNRRAEEKSCVVRALRERLPGPMAAYANSSSDIPHLELTDHPLLVNGSPGAQRSALGRGIACASWR